MYIVCRNCAENCKKPFFLWGSGQNVRLTLPCINCPISYQGVLPEKPRIWENCRPSGVSCGDCPIKSEQPHFGICLYGLATMTILVYFT